MEHGATVLDLTIEQWSTLGYRVEAEGKSVAISGDAVADASLGQLASAADALVMCAYLSEEEIASDADQLLVDGILAGAPQAAAFAEDAGVRRLVLTHIREKSDQSLALMRDQVSTVFGGDVIVGEDLMTIEV